MSRAIAVFIGLLAVLTPPLALPQHLEIPPNLQRALGQLLPGAVADEISLSPIEGFYQVVIGAEIVYVSADGRYIVRGDFIDLEQNINVTEVKRREARLNLINSLDATSIAFTPERVAHRVHVFTDVDCGYCARLHSQIAEYNALGIEVRYVAFPRAGVPSASYDKTVSVWCSDDPHKAIGDAKFGRAVEPRSCDNPVKDHYVTGQLLGVSGTPTIVLDSGAIVPGYVPPAKLLDYLERLGKG